MAPENVPKILIIDDELPICKNCIKILSGSADEIDYALNGYDALKLLERKPYHVVITDLKMSRMGGMEVLSRIKKNYPDIMVIVITGFASVSSAVEVMKKGAYDYLPKPFTPHELRAVVAQAMNHHKIKMKNKQLMSDQKKFPVLSHQLIGSSPQIKKVVSMIKKVAHTESTVLIHGNSGTGKELVARALHANSTRKDKVFFAVDCGTLTGNLLESELFGHRKGAFTDAHRDKDGIFQIANHGTIFLDEISNISIEVQGKLLRFLDSREFMPVGDTKYRKVDIRLIFATNRELKQMVKDGTFRNDFYYRIAVYPIWIPPLKERKSDILPIAYYFLEQFNRSMGKSISGYDDNAVNRLTGYDWPGNVRQLRNIIERAVILCEGDHISLNNLPHLNDIGDIEKLIEHVPSTSDELKQIKKEVRQKSVHKVEKNFILNALKKNKWNITRAARTTGMQRPNFQNMMKKHGIKLPGK
ncbi:MAG: sigma-54-dependent Fis family transcriptional regulator [Desulfobacteraceae bacterium]|nr:sigma-54-dependent Fis family transcriptional regulator [Desulfobacteraceae bacterium]MBC2756440.1 sigma-54-dependent Fis family transcriptional regulator [Desulfobacteraceae bacterium]MBC2763570.1 sigma-54-dependent Fis family transcriptional regulator [ANME-2 cluster archaeon]